MSHSPEKLPPLRKYSSLTCDILSELRNSGEYADVILRTDDQRLFQVHRAILCSCSSFFRALFTNGMNETTDRIVDIHDVKGDIMELILDYAYTHEIKLDENNILRILPAANQLQVLGLFSLCENYLHERLSPENVLGIREFAAFFFCKRLHDQAQVYLLSHFTEISIKSEEFLELQMEQVIDILNSDELNVKSEEAVFDAILRWIDYKTDERKPHIVDLLKCVRLGLLTTNFFLDKVKCHPYIVNNEDCKPLMIDTLKYLYELDVDTYQDLLVQKPIARPRLPHEILFVCGGWSGGSPTSAVELYDTRADKWIQLPINDKFHRAYHGIAAINQLIYVIGGFDGMDYFNSCRVFDTQLFQWNEVAPMNIKRCYVSVAAHDGLIYAMVNTSTVSSPLLRTEFRAVSTVIYGKIPPNATRLHPINGYQSLRCMLSDQVFFIEKPSVISISIELDASATVLEDRIYICGGFNGQECMHSAEYFDPKTSQWTMIAPMRHRRSGVGVIAYHSCLYALGGFNGSTRMNSGERYNPKTNTWTPVPDMYNPRSNFAVGIVDDYLFVIGGFNGVTTIFNVECFDDLAEEWYDAADMNVFRSALSACVLSGLDNVRNLITYARQQIIDEQRSKHANAARTDFSPSSIIAVGTLSAAVGTLSATIDNIASSNM